ncbi:MAG TPA: sigma-70 family RNA polymerase sigma factor [Ktedonobacterales bacterium]|nr:sigma-70 family RNA polymerase sigma factor [Ktedonobacterales bacterium]
MERLGDEQLLAAVLAGEMAALTLLVKRYQRPLTGYLERLLGGDWPLAQDLTQETFLRVLRQRDCRGQRPFKPWLYAIATNLARDHFKSAASRRVAPLDPLLAENLVAEEAGPEEQALAQERGQTIMAALDTLSEEYRATLLLRFSSDLSLHEIADTLDIPLGTVKSRLTVGLRRLRAALSSAEERDARYEREGSR